MRRVFADTGYWIALLNPRDGLHAKAREVSTASSRARVVTSEMVLTEVLNAFASKGEALRKAVCALVEQVRSNPNAQIVSITGTAFPQAVDPSRAPTPKRRAPTART